MKVFVIDVYPLNHGSALVHGNELSQAIGPIFRESLLTIFLITFSLSRPLKGTARVNHMADEVEPLTLEVPMHFVEETST